MHNINEQDAADNKNTDKSAADSKTVGNGTFEQATDDGYEGGNLGSAGSGTMEIAATPTSTENCGNVAESKASNDSISNGNNNESDDNYEGGNMGTAGSGGMDLDNEDSTKA